MIVSFAWTTDAFLCGDKRVTRRDWKARTAQQYQPGTIHKASNKVLFAGGEIVGAIRVVSIRREPLARLIDDPAYGRAEWLAEGGPWYWPDAATFVGIFEGREQMFRLEFEIAFLNPRGNELRAAARARRPAFYTSK